MKENVAIIQIGLSSLLKRKHSIFLNAQILITALGEKWCSDLTAFTIHINLLPYV